MLYGDAPLFATQKTCVQNLSVVTFGPQCQGNGGQTLREGRRRCRKSGRNTHKEDREYPKTRFSESKYKKRSFAPEGFLFPVVPAGGFSFWGVLPPEGFLFSMVSSHC